MYTRPNEWSVQAAGSMQNENQTSPRGKYTRVGQTNKQTLIYLVTKEGHSIKEAALNLGINYSTAKSILLFLKMLLLILLRYYSGASISR